MRSYACLQTERMEGGRQSGLPNRDWGGDIVRSLKGQEWRMPQFLHRKNGIGYWVSQLGQPWKKERPHLRKPEELPLSHPQPPQRPV